MNQKSNRIAWLINHPTLVQFEPHILRKLGFEVFVPKIMPDYSLFSAVEACRDDLCTIDIVDLKTLNQHNFYEQEFTQAVTDALNVNFGTVICSAFKCAVKQICINFKGKIVVRVFGREAPYSYSDTNYFGCFIDMMKQVHERLIFAPCYDSIPRIEGDFLQTHSVVLPVGVPESILLHKNTWIGEKNQILFVCKSAGICPYYKKVFQDFKHNFGDLPHVIAGDQKGKTKDPNETGYLSDSDYKKLFVSCKVMFYHSREPRHLHYHPLESVVFGMPLIYMSGGLLEEFGGKKQPGLCNTFAEAREKCERILNGDLEFIKTIVSSQTKLLDTFTEEYNLSVWRKRFIEKIVETTPNPTPQDIPIYSKTSDASDATEIARTDIECEKLQESVKICGFPKQMREMHVTLGIGDIFLFSLLAYHQKSQHNTIFVLSKDILQKYRNDSKSYARCIESLLQSFSIKYRWQDKNNFQKELSMTELMKTNNLDNVSIYRDVLANLLMPFNADELKSSLPQKYVLIHTKCRMEKNHFISTEAVAAFSCAFKCRYPIVIVGEREVTKNFENNLLKVRCFYDVLQKNLSINNVIIDCTCAEIQSDQSLLILKEDIYRIYNAECNIVFGVGGNLVLTSLFSKKFVDCGVDIDHHLLNSCPHGVFTNDWSVVGHVLKEFSVDRQPH